MIRQKDEFGYINDHVLVLNGCFLIPLRIQTRFNVDVDESEGVISETRTRVTWINPCHQNGGTLINDSSSNWKAKQQG